MKNIEKILSLIIIVTCFFACTNNPETDFTDDGESSVDGTTIMLSQCEKISIAYDNPGTISDDKIIGIIQDFQKIYNIGETQTRAMIPLECNIKSRYFVRDTISKRSSVSRSSIEEFSSIPFCDVEVSDGGIPKIAVVCCDERASKVIYYGDYGTEDQSEIPVEIKLLLYMGQSSVMKDIERVENIKDSLRASTIQKISQKLKIPQNEVSYNRVKRYIEDESQIMTRTDTGGIETPSQLLRYVAPMSTTAWEQTHPYNLKMETVKMRKTIINAQGQIETQIYEGKADAGCAVIAISQLCAIIHPLMLYTPPTGNNQIVDWGYLYADHPWISQNGPYGDNDPEDRIDMVASIIRTNYIDSQSYLRYDNENKYYLATSTNLDGLLAGLSTRHLYNTHTAGTYFNKDNALTSLFTKKSPVLLYGNGVHAIVGTNEEIERPGHVWIIDGFAECKQSGQSYVTDYYWSVNMGWGKNSAKRFFLASNDPNDCPVIFYNNGKRSYIKYNTKDQGMIYNFFYGFLK